jgi:transcriptional regulator with XRE-family HTH domain
MTLKRSDILLNFGIRLKTLRKSKGLSQEQLADLANLDRSYIGGVERGERNISLINIYEISKALSTEPSELFMGEK